MNFERFNPLAGYFSSDLPKEVTKDLHADLSNDDLGIGDWGIEESTLSSPSSRNPSVSNNTNNIHNHNNGNFAYLNQPPSYAYPQASHFKRPSLSQHSSISQQSAGPFLSPQQSQFPHQSQVPVSIPQNSYSNASVPGHHPQHSYSTSNSNGYQYNAHPNHYPNHDPNHYPNHYPTHSNLNSYSMSNQEPITELSFNTYYQHLNPHPIPPTTESFRKFIQKYLKLDLQNEFWDKFKYNLIISNLLDDSMVLSKNEQSLNTLIHLSSNFQMRDSVFFKTLNDDGTQLILTTRNYTLKFPHFFYSKYHVISVIYLIIFLLKQNMLQKGNANFDQTKMFKILLIISTKIVKFKRINMMLQMNKVLNHLNVFLVHNFKINKKIIVNLINVKNLKLFKHLPRVLNASSGTLGHLNYTLNFLLFNLKSSIIKLLPIVNGPVLEQYCNINNIDLDSDLCLDQENDNVDEPLKSNLVSNSNLDTDEALNVIIKKITLFNKLRKFLICQLLTIDGGGRGQPNFFLLKIIDKFNANAFEHEIKELGGSNISLFEKLLILEEFFRDHNKVLDNFNLLFDKFEKLNKLDEMTIDNENQDILKAKEESNTEIFNNDSMNQLIMKVSNLSTNLTFFRKYNNSTIDNKNELQEKLLIFHQFQDDIEAIKQLYKLNLQDLNYEMNEAETDELMSSVSHSNSATPSASNRNSRNSGEFSLKSFHTSGHHSGQSLSHSLSGGKYPKNSDIKKRFSLPANSRSVSSPIAPQDENDDKSDKSYKRLSTGLKLGLLTVFEDEKQMINGSKSPRGSLQSNRQSQSSSSSQLQSPLLVQSVNMTQPQSNNKAGTNFKRGKRQPTAFDDNYINILPPNNYDTYNQATLDSLSKRKPSNSNRFSVNSLNSNLSGISELLSSTQVTSFDEIDENALSKDELKFKLEESLNRIYKLEKQVECQQASNSPQIDTQKLNRNSTEKEFTNNESFDERFNNDENCEPDLNSDKLKDYEIDHNETTLSKSFLSDLEKTLNK